MNRVIGHLDLDYFYAQVEEIENPSLKDKPVLVCVFSGRTEDSGVVSTANYKAREYGTRSGMPIAMAKRRLENTDAVFIKMDHDKYALYSERVMEIVRSEVDAMEQAGIDETFFEITKTVESSYDAATKLALQLKAAILEEERLTCSIGLGPTRIVAKIASDLKKPDGLVVVKDTAAFDFLSALPIEKVYGVGPKTAGLLEAIGIRTIANLASFPVDRLEDVVGKKLAVYLHDASNCIDDQPLTDRTESSQLSRIITLKTDTHDLDQILLELAPAVGDLHERLVSNNLFFRNVSAIGILKNLSTHTKSKTLERPTNDHRVLENEVKALFAALLEVGDLRRAGVRISGLEDMADQRSLTEFTG